MKNTIYLILLLFSLAACNNKTITISDNSNSRVGNHAAIELRKYLSKIYPDITFELKDNTSADIQFILSAQVSNSDFSFNSIPDKRESFKILLQGEKAIIVSPDQRGLLNATYALLEKLGYGFYISGDVIPDTKKWKGFKGWEMEDAPVIKERTLFNWHNFLSGCTGWNREDWKLWIDQANKMRFNSIMIHAYGNNPMFSYDYLGETKPTGYLNNTKKGRDWGNEHVNDVRRITGGQIFKKAVYGANVSLVEESEKVEKTTALMQEVFEYAEHRGTKVIFALDFDTWMAHPKNITQKLPQDALFEVYGNLAPNPEHPEGYKYYKHQVQQLLDTYPQIDELTTWNRAPSNKIKTQLGAMWTSFSYDMYPPKWKKEYKEIMSKHTQLNDDLTSQGMFAYSKVVLAIQKAVKEINPNIKVGCGSWHNGWLKVADAFFPEGLSAFRPLDYKIEFNKPSTLKLFSELGTKRPLQPIVWAHHDDYGYIGRPYAPFSNLSNLITENNIKGLSIIHWTTHPLDLYFTGTARQLWKNSANELVDTTVNNYVQKRFGQSDPNLQDYYLDWLTNGPMFGRETSDHFIDLGKLHWLSRITSWRSSAQEAKKRVVKLAKLPPSKRNNYWKYQMGMEEFYISFFENQAAFTKAYNLTQKGRIEDASQCIQNTNPDITIEKYVAAMKQIGFTPGEEALLISLNTRWKTDYINLKQQLGLEAVRVKFAPTQHDTLAQMPGSYTYYIDKNLNWHRCLWEFELKGQKFVDKDDKSALQINNQFRYDLTSMHGQKLSPMHYELHLDVKTFKTFSMTIYENNQQISSKYFSNNSKDITLPFKSSGGHIQFEINAANGLEVLGFTLYQKKGHCQTF